MSMLRHSATIAAVIWFAALGTARAENARAETWYGERHVVASLWYPDDLLLVRGLIVFTGSQAEGKSAGQGWMIELPFWRRFAENIGFGLVATDFYGKYTEASDGNGQGLLDAITQLGEMTNHPELAHAPLLPLGFSNGGYFTFTFTQRARSPHPLR